MAQAAIGLSYFADPLNATESIEAHLAALKNQSGAVVFVNGTYQLKRPIVLTPGISLVGSTGTILQWADGAAGDTAMITLDSWCDVSAMTLIGTGKGVGIATRSGCSHYSCDSVRAQSFAHGYEFENSYVGLFTNCCALYNTVSGIHFKGTYVMDHRFLGGECAGNPVGVLLDGGQHYGHTFSMVVESNSVYGIAIPGAVYNVRIRDCYFELNTQVDVIVTGRTEGLVIDGNLFIRTPMAIALDGSAMSSYAHPVYTNIVNNSFYSTTPWRIDTTVEHTNIGFNNLAAVPAFASASPALSQALASPRLFDEAMFKKIMVAKQTAFPLRNPTLRAVGQAIKSVIDKTPPPMPK